MSTTEILIEVKNLTKTYSSNEMDTKALAGIDLKIESGELIAITGPSGCGKSTLLSILGLLDVPSNGEYILKGTNVHELDNNQRALIRNQHIGFVFQSFNLISNLSVEENVGLPLTYQKGWSANMIKERTKTVLEKVDMQHRRGHFPGQLSGGQQQRVAVARALVSNPSVILADEPTGNLDSKNAERVLELLQALNDEGSTICMVTHDPRTAEVAKRNVALLDGLVAEDQSGPLLEMKLA